MATLLPDLTCALCEKGIDPTGAYFRTSGQFLPADDPLARYCDAPMHWACYEAWSERPRFARAYVDAWVVANRKNPFWWMVHRDEQVYLSVNPQPPVEEASVRLSAVGSDIRVPLPKWTAWLADPEAVTPTLQPVETVALTEVLPVLRERYADDHAVVHAIDVDEKRPRARRKGG